MTHFSGAVLAVFQSASPGGVTWRNYSRKSCHLRKATLGGGTRRRNTWKNLQAVCPMRNRGDGNCWSPSSPNDDAYATGISRLRRPISCTDRFDAATHRPAGTWGWSQRLYGPSDQKKRAAAAPFSAMTSSRNRNTHSRPADVQKILQQICVEVIDISIRVSQFSRVRNSCDFRTA